MARVWNPEEAARYVRDAHRARADFHNLPSPIGPETLAEAYAAQTAYNVLNKDAYGPAFGRKIATTTPVMQRLMGIGHPCGGFIFRDTIRPSGTRLNLADHISLKLECELATRLGRDLPADASWTSQSIRPYVDAVTPAFELVEDRNADYNNTSALSLIVENCWNAGVVLGTWKTLDDGLDLRGRDGFVDRNNGPRLEGKTDDPLGALAWVANLASSQGDPLKAGMLVMTGSVVATMGLGAGDEISFTIDGIGTVAVSAHHLPSE